MISSRLPGMLLMVAINRVSMLEFMVIRLKKSKLTDDIIIATTINEGDNGIVDLCKKLKINYESRNHLFNL
tara:strand:- start:7 stop:219 length:213 start_codon:yes stop_codon:yes gene_type:complete